MSGLYSKRAEYSDRGTQGENVDAGPFLGVVMNNKDVTLQGRLEVWISKLGGDQMLPSSWVNVRYANPFYGISPYSLTNKINNSVSASDFAANERNQFTAGQMDNAQRQGPVMSYGMWVQPPAVGTKVLVCFADGNKDNGFWFAAVPEIAHGMIPAIGKGTSGQPEAEFDPGQIEVHNASDVAAVQREPHPTVPTTFSTQGLAEDQYRGYISTSSLRESPSNVMGFSTPAGHSFAMDDGDQGGTSKLIRLRSAAGNQITMHDDTGMIYLINSTGNSWVELSPSGQIDVYGTTGINLASEGDINIHGNKNVSIHAGENLKLVAMKGAKLQGTEELQLHGKKTMLEGVDSLHIHSCKEIMITSFKDIFIKAFNYLVVQGKCFRWNSGTAKEAEQVPPEKPADVDGYQTTVARAPSHEPYKSHDNGSSGAAGGAPGSTPGGSTSSGELAGQTIPGAGGPGTTGSVPSGAGSAAMTQAYGNTWGGVTSGVSFSRGINVVDVSQRPTNSDFGVTATQNADYFQNMIIHNNPGSSAAGTLSYINKYDAGRGFSPGYSVVIDRNNIYYAAPPNVRTNGTDGNPIANNNNSLHVVVINENDPVSQATLKEFTQKVAVEKLGIPPSNVRGHGEVDPSNAGEMAKVAADTRASLDGSKVASAPYSPAALKKQQVAPTSQAINTPATSTAAATSSVTKPTTAVNPKPITTSQTARPSWPPPAGTTSVKTFTPATSVSGGPGAPIYTKPASLTLQQTNAAGTPTREVTITQANAVQSQDPFKSGNPADRYSTSNTGQRSPTDDRPPVGQSAPNASATAAQDSTAAAQQLSGQQAASSIPAAPGGGSTPGFAKGDNCQRPAGGGGGSPGAGQPTGVDGRPLSGEPMSAEEEAAFVEKMKADAAAKGITLTDADIANLKGVYAGEGYGGVVTAMNRASISGQSVTSEILRGGYVGYTGPNYGSMTKGFSQEYSDWSAGKYPQNAVYILSPGYRGGTPYNNYGSLNPGYNQVLSGGTGVNDIYTGPWP